MTIELLEAEDIALLNKVQPEGWYDIRPIHRYYFDEEHCFTYKLMVEGEIAGIGTIIYHRNIAWLAHILVKESFRKRGFGIAISKHLLEESEKNNIETVYLKATDMGAPLYSKLGFETETEYIAYKDFKPYSGQLSSNICAYNHDLNEEVLGLDFDITGEIRVADLNPVLDSTYLYVKNNVVEGVYYTELGDGHIIADTEEAGLELMKFRLTSAEDAIFPQENSSAKEFMENLNVKASYTIKRMRLGKKQVLDFSKMFNRIGGYLG